MPPWSFILEVRTQPKWEQNKAHPYFCGCSKGLQRRTIFLYHSGGISVTLTLTWLCSRIGQRAPGTWSSLPSDFLPRYMVICQPFLSDLKEEERVGVKEATCVGEESLPLHCPLSFPIQEQWKQAWKEMSNHGQSPVGKTSPVGFTDVPNLFGHHTTKSDGLHEKCDVSILLSVCCFIFLGLLQEAVPGFSFGSADGAN